MKSKITADRRRRRPNFLAAAALVVLGLVTACTSATTSGSPAPSVAQASQTPYVITNNTLAPGKHLYIPAGRYVALGDSFSSGEGNKPFDPSTDHAGLIGTSDTCHRSQKVAYSLMLRSIDTGPGVPVPSYQDFVACSGAQSQALFAPNQDNTSELPQILRLSKQYGRVGLVTMTMGGNDVGFGPIIRKCLLRAQSWQSWLLAPIAVVPSGSCQSQELQHGLDIALNWIDGTRADNHNPLNLKQVYRLLHKVAPYARILILGYPHEFQWHYGHDCVHIDAADLDWANRQLTDRLNNVIRANVQAAGGAVQYVDTVPYFAQYPQCGGSGTSAFWGVDHSLGSDIQGYFHPNFWGQQQLARAVLDKLSNPLPRTFPAPPTQGPSNTTTASCNQQTFVNALGSSNAGASPTPSGSPTCADGYAMQVFTAGPGGQPSQFFFKQDSFGRWVLIDGGQAISEIACSTIPGPVLAKLGAQCPVPQPSPSPNSPCSSAVFLKVLQAQGALVTGTVGQPTCIDGYAMQDFTFPQGPTSNYPTFFFYRFNGPLGWRVLGGGAIGDARSVCAAMPANVRAAFTSGSTGCPAG
jgi:lysophospholipase L1-like esterase